MRPAGFFGGLLVAALPGMLLLSALNIISTGEAFAIGVISLVLGAVLVVADS